MLQPPKEPSCHPKWSPALETTLASMVVSEDPRLALNGFRLDEAGRLTGAWDATSGLEDLVNVVGCVAMSPDEEVGVQDVRPLKYKTFLEGEAVRMQRQVRKTCSSPPLSSSAVSTQWVSPMGDFLCFYYYNVLLTMRRAVIYFINLFLNL